MSAATNDFPEDQFDHLERLPEEIAARLLNDDCLKCIPIVLYKKGLPTSELLKSKGPKLTRAKTLSQLTKSADFLFSDEEIKAAASKTGLAIIVFPGEIFDLDPESCLMKFRQRISFVEYPKLNESAAGIGISGARAGLRALTLLSGWEASGFSTQFTPQDGARLYPQAVGDDGNGGALCCVWDLVLDSCFLPDLKTACPLPEVLCDLHGKPDASDAQFGVKLSWDLSGALSVPSAGGGKNDLEDYDPELKKVWYTVDTRPPVKGSANTVEVAHGALGWQSMITVDSSAPVYLRWFAGGPGLQDSNVGIKKIDPLDLL